MLLIIGKNVPATNDLDMIDLYAYLIGQAECALPQKKAKKKPGVCRRNSRIEGLGGRVLLSGASRPV